MVTSLLDWDTSGSFRNSIKFIRCRKLNFLYAIIPLSHRKDQNAVRAIECTLYV